MEKNLRQDSVSSVGSTDSGSSSGNERSINEMLEILVNWLKKFVVFQNERDPYIVALWIIHTWLIEQGYTTPRLLIDSPMPGSGKTTLIENLEKFCNNAIPIASLSSVAVLGRLTNQGITTLLIDEADRALDPKKEGVRDIIALINSGYKKGGFRVLNERAGKRGEKHLPTKMPTFSPVAMAGNAPNLPEDTRTRCIVVRLLPDVDNQAQECDWEHLEPWAIQIKCDIEASLAKWRLENESLQPPLPKDCIGRFRDKWKPLKRIAVLAGADWAERVDQHILQDIENVKEQKENGDAQLPLHMQLAKDLHEVFEGEFKFVGTESLLTKLARQNPEYWGESSMSGKITARKFGWLNSKFGFTSQRNTEGVRGYHSKLYEGVWKALGLTPSKPTEPTELPKPTAPESDNGEIW